VNFTGIADMTLMNKGIFERLKYYAVKKDGILYSPPDFLRMGMYLELSRPEGDVSRWEKVLKRINLLNKFFPLKTSKKCVALPFQRTLEMKKNQTVDVENLHNTIRDHFVDDGCVFFGGYAARLYSRYMKNSDVKEKFLQIAPDFDVLSKHAKEVAQELVSKLSNMGFNATSVEHEEIGELIPKRFEVKVNGETVAFLYEPIACHNYNTIRVNNKTVKVATIDTILSFYLAFIYSDEYANDRNRLLCIAAYLFEVIAHNRLDQNGLLKRFNIDCIGSQKTLQEIKQERFKIYEELREKKDTLEYNMHFFNYRGKGKGSKISDRTNKTNKTNKTQKAKLNETTKPLKTSKTTKRYPRKEDDEYLI
jgi:hypothetical protein